LFNNSQQKYECVYAIIEDMNKLKQKSSIYSLVLIALALPAAYCAALVSELILKMNNPKNIDITADLAYLGNSLWVGFGVFFSLMFISIVLALFGLKSQHPKIARLSLIVIALISLLSIASFFTQKKIENTEAAYSKSKIQDLFAPLREQLKNKKQPN
jgi:ABC-type multidrug transport system fused ATPase/permease subunit